VTSQETILDIVGKPRQHGKDVGRHGGERFVFRVGPVYLIGELSGVVVHDGRPSVGVHFDGQDLPDLETDGRCKEVPCLASARATRTLLARACIALLISPGSSVTVKGGSPLSSSLRSSK
jgi:hypothetical protein